MNQQVSNELADYSSVLAGLLCLEMFFSYGLSLLAPTDRSEEIESIKYLFTAKLISPEFGVVLDPSGKGKTYACNESPGYVLYHEIISPKSAPPPPPPPPPPPEELAKAAGMPV